MAVEHRYTHEYGETSSKPKHTPAIEFKMAVEKTPREEAKSKSVTQTGEMKNKFEAALQQARSSQESPPGLANGRAQKSNMAASVTASVIGQKLQEERLV